MTNRRIDRSYVAAAQVLDKKTGATGKTFDVSLRRKLAMWASYNEKIERACAPQVQR